MRRILLALWLLVFCACIGTSQNVTLTGTMHAPGGDPLNGYLYLQTAQPATVLSTCSGGPTYVLPKASSVITVTNGSLVGTNMVWGSDCLSPGTPYIVEIKDSNGNVLVRDQWLIYGTTFDVGTAVSTLSSQIGNYKGVWNSATTYSIGDEVSYGGPIPTYYYSVANSNVGNSPPTSPAYWYLPGTATGIQQLTGDVLAGPGAGTQSATLSGTGVTAGTYGDATHVPRVTVDAKGRLQSVVSTAITFPSFPAHVNSINGYTGDFIFTGSAVSCSGTGPIYCVFTMGSGGGGGGGSGLSGMTAGQVAIAGASNLITTSKAIQGSDTKLLSSGTIAAAGLTLCADTAGGASTTGCANPWQASFTFVGVPAASQILLLVPTTVAVTIPGGCAGSYLGATVSATASTAITITKLSGGPLGSATTLCTGTFAASGTIASFSGSGGTLAVGDYIEITGPAGADATLANIGGAIYGTHS